MKCFAVVGTLVAVLATGGCATKSYVRKSIDPVNGKVEEQGKTFPMK